jgi:hypothetical protein
MFVVRSKIETIATFNTEAEALAYIERLGPEFIEADEDHPGCYDALLANGRILSIEAK